MVEIQNLIYLLRFVKYNLEPYGSNIAMAYIGFVYIFILTLAKGQLGVVRDISYLLLANSCFVCKSLVILTLDIFLVILIILIMF